MPCTINLAGQARFFIEILHPSTLKRSFDAVAKNNEFSFSFITQHDYLEVLRRLNPT